MHSIAETFIGALHRLEEQGNVTAIAAIFADDPELSNPLKRQRGKESAVSFWRSYRESFGTIKSDFRNVLELGEVTFLEWVSHGTVGDQPVCYGGVTVLERAADNRFSELLRSQSCSSEQQQTAGGARMEDAQAQLAQNRMEGGYQ